MRIKDILGNQHDESDAVLSESLRRLQLMELSVDVLKVLILHSFVSFLFYAGLRIRIRTHTLLQEFDDFKVLVTPSPPHRIQSHFGLRVIRFFTSGFFSFFCMGCWMCCSILNCTLPFSER
uniref:Uncharacterized protein n=1 Tax=Musa acuminata subsp. malaccensis TaxID=214687 RepID=A0A804L729_MUSAM